MPIAMTRRWRGCSAPLRWLVAQIISRARDKKAQAIYAHLGGQPAINAYAGLFTA